tara:strand:+ start:1999 stop:2337 length:339 start_codon:yes stop_codon:yes gene_type:complete
MSKLKCEIEKLKNVDGPVDEKKIHYISINGMQFEVTQFNGCKDIARFYGLEDILSIMEMERLEQPVPLYAYGKRLEVTLQSMTRGKDERGLYLNVRICNVNVKRPQEIKGNS